ncbi:MAG TPA: tRNA (uridine(34)/cytosine(34)/5-carboxymethylaminomethyluridine(34)-2'-O)-methyltransferase TrmL [Nitrospiraceae bacterium]|nr:tRNA (uridine(34)/cytosine(34)/5-carboxymethylaminomethyluridine(34)-2'-O)-methyltransferase TrmL [Nitrospiraceae bacterium]
MVLHGSILKSYIMLHVVLYQPEIPPNTGNIARQCVGMNACLHLIGPTGFDISHSAARRAGLDHWNELSLTVHKAPDDFLQWLGDRTPWLVTKHGTVRFDIPEYADEDIIVLGSETRGLPQEWLQKWSARTVYVPILGRIRSYNLANTAGIVLAQASLKAGLYESGGR